MGNVSNDITNINIKVSFLYCNMDFKDFKDIKDITFVEPGFRTVPPQIFFEISISF